MISITAEAIATDLCIDPCASRLGMFILFQDKDAGSFSHDKTVAILIKGSRSPSWIIVLVERAFMTEKPATPRPQITASVPPLTTISQRPYLTWR